MMVPIVLGGAALLLYLATKSKPAGIGAPGGPGNGTTVQGRSGTVYLVAPNMNPMPVAPGAKVFDVFLMSGTRVLSFVQMGSDKSSRQLVAASLPATDPIFLTAKSDWL